MDHQHVVGTLPAFVALDSSPVLAGQRRGTSIQLDDTYFTGQLRAFEAFDADSEERSTPGFAERPQDLRESLQRYRQIEIDIDSLTEADLWTASTRFRRELRRIPEIDFLKRQFPGRCFVVPEWLQSGDRLHYGARVYFFGSEESTTPEDVIRENIDGILHDSSQQLNGIRVGYTAIQTAVSSFITNARRPLHRPNGARSSRLLTELPTSRSEMALLSLSTRCCHGSPIGRVVMHSSLGNFSPNRDATLRGPTARRSTTNCRLRNPFNSSRIISDLRSATTISSPEQSIPAARTGRHREISDRSI